MTKALQILITCLTVLRLASSADTQDACASSEARSCDQDGESVAEQSVSLLQARHELVKAEVAEEELDEKPPQPLYRVHSSPRPVIQYFKNWAMGSIASRLERSEHTGPTLFQRESDSAALTSEQAVASLTAAQAAQCPQQLQQRGSKAYVVLDAEAADSNGIRHTLLQRSDGALQYVAAHRAADGILKALVADPAVCQKMQGTFLQDESGTDMANKSHGHGGGANKSHGHGGGAVASKDADKISGEPEMVTVDDPAVQDCKKLFLRTAHDDCHKNYTLHVTPGPTVTIQDGVVVKMHVKLCGPHGRCGEHHPECAFEKDLDKSDASLFQRNKTHTHKTDSSASDPTDMEKEGMAATLKLYVPLCDADATNDTAQTQSLVENYAMGELSLYKGYEHVNDKLPLLDASILQLDGEAELDESDVDLRIKYEKCFPKLPDLAPGSETVRNQGTCGSCWAFASSTTIMESLCISDHGAHDALATPSDRFEVSVQKLISCSPRGEGHDPAKWKAQRGCSGGYMSAVDDGVNTWGLTHERDNIYKCGGGDPKNHFSVKSTSCDAFPWGGQCTGQPDPTWLWGTPMQVDGEEDMKKALMSGTPLYASLTVYPSFMDLTTGVWTKSDQENCEAKYKDKTTGLCKPKGGHALNIPGYGVQDGTKYWLLQNSWGHKNWGINGYGKILRGVDLAGIETKAYITRAWIKGGKEPPCADSKDGSGISSTGAAPYFPCSRYADACDGRFASTLAKRCMKTCGKCGATGETPPPVPPSPPVPPPTPAPTPPPAPTTCTDSTTYRSPNGWSCEQWKGKVCSSTELQEQCPLTCGTIPPCAPPKCPDAPQGTSNSICVCADTKEKSHFESGGKKYYQCKPKKCPDSPSGIPSSDCVCAGNKEKSHFEKEGKKYYSCKPKKCPDAPQGNSNPDCVCEHGKTKSHFESGGSKFYQCKASCKDKFNNCADYKTSCNADWFKPHVASCQKTCGQC